VIFLVFVFGNALLATFTSDYEYGIE